MVTRVHATGVLAGLGRSAQLIPTKAPRDHLPVHLAVNVDMRQVGMLEEKFVKLDQAKLTVGLSKGKDLGNYINAVEHKL
eukprot:11174790-Lingulodinium_polyedra.AAC.1